MEREGKIPPAGEMSAKRAKGGRIKAHLVIQSPPANACQSRHFAERSEIFREYTVSREIWRLKRVTKSLMDFVYTLAEAAHAAPVHSYTSSISPPPRTVSPAYSTAA